MIDTTGSKKNFLKNCYIEWFLKGTLFTGQQSDTVSEANVQDDNSTRSKPPVDLNKKVPPWPGLSWPGQAKTERFLKSTEGFEQVEFSPCSRVRSKENSHSVSKSETIFLAT